MKIKLKDSFEIDGVLFQATGQESNLGFEYEIKKDLGDSWLKLHNRYFKTFEEVEDYLYEALTEANPETAKTLVKRIESGE